jgi:hypothetical protein
MELSDQLHIPAALFPGKEPPVPIGWEAEWASEPDDSKQLSLPTYIPTYLPT